MEKAQVIEAKIARLVRDEDVYNALHDWIDSFSAIELSHVGRNTKSDVLTDARMALAINDRVYALQQIRYRLEKLRADTIAKGTEG